MGVKTDLSSAVMKERELLIKCEGLLSFMAGKPAIANPFERGSMRAGHWAYGWMKGQELKNG